MATPTFVRYCKRYERRMRRYRGPKPKHCEKCGTPLGGNHDLFCDIFLDVNQKPLDESTHRKGRHGS